MQVLTSQQCSQIAGGVPSGGALIGIAAASCAVGYIASNVTSYFGPFYTVVGTVGGGAAGGIAGLMFGGPIGAIAFSGMGALTGYFVASTLANAGAFFVGTTGTAFFIYKYLPL